jgi:hypothetical protein
VVTLFLAGLALSSMPLAPLPEPLLILGTDGSISAPGARLLPGTRVVSCPFGTAFDFDGDHAGIELPDEPRLRLSGSFSISVRLNLRSYVTSQNSAPGAQVLFRGDDRSGSDPYHLTVLEGGTISLSVEDGRGAGADVRAPIQLLRWTQVLATFDAARGELKLYLDGRLLSFTTTAIRPFSDLDLAARPGIGIGNVQRASSGQHNQPVNGQICDLRLYDCVLTPAELEAKTFRCG